MPTSLDTDLVKDLLRSFNFEKLFAELGWDHLNVQSINIAVDRANYELEAVAQKRGVQVFVCWAQSIPGATLRHKIDSRLTQHAHEHLLIFAEMAKARQVWQWVAHEAGQPQFLRSFEWRRGQDGSVLAQRLAEIAVPISEEEAIDLTTMTHRLKDAFDRDKVTKRFYERFAKEREQFQSSIKGLSDDNAKWYTSVIVDRLMFIYFLQKQGFLAAGDRDYLRGKLDFMQFKGPDHYYGEFLRTLFFEGFAKPVSERSPEVQRMLGDIPYLNGGLFAPHPLEEAYADTIRITDAAFEKLLTFFDQYQWTLDDRVVAQENESDIEKRPDDQINPDVLGYIFEKYVNQKQMGAYYTKEDITGYISQETIIPRLFDMVKAAYKPAFSGMQSVFMLLKDDPDAYIYPSMRKGARDGQGNMMSLPDSIAQGLHDVNERGDWNKPADSDYALPTEIWREVVARTQRYEEVRKHCANGDITDINDLITYNLDIRQFAQDAIAQSDDPIFVLEFYKALTVISVLDPTCGSGAFLFAALNILERLYEACLQRMEQFQQDGIGYIGQALRAVQQFDAILREADRHSNRRYFILKSIVVRNLYGVDIMEEAVEICKLRLFLRLVAELKPGQPVEPLPDIDFNIKAGNTLVGYVSLEDVKASRAEEFFGKDRLPMIEQQAEDLARLYRKMQDQQMFVGGTVTPDDKRALQLRRQQLAEELDRYLAWEHDVHAERPNELADWRRKAQPFHWFAEFYDIAHSGGFDAIVGNPPYVDYAKVKTLYQVRGYETMDCGDLYSYVLERSLGLVTSSGHVGLIVRLASMATPKTSSLRVLLQRRKCGVHVSAYSASAQPSCLFEGVRDRLCIYLLQPGASEPRVYSSSFLKWLTEERPTLFTAKLRYVEVSQFSSAALLPRLGDQESVSIYAQMSKHPILKTELSKGGSAVVYFHESPVYWTKAWRTVPYYWQEGQGVVRSVSLRELRLSSPRNRDVMYCLANSSTLYWFLAAASDCRHLTSETFDRFPVFFAGLQDTQYTAFARLAEGLEEDYAKHKRLYVRVSRSTGESRFDAYYPAKSKAIIDRIDAMCGDAYGLSPAETDYVANYDVKYRMGIGGEDGEDDV